MIAERAWQKYGNKSDGKSGNLSKFTGDAATPRFAAHTRTDSFAVFPRTTVTRYCLVYYDILLLLKSFITNNSGNLVFQIFMNSI